MRERNGEREQKREAETGPLDDNRVTVSNSCIQRYLLVSKIRSLFVGPCLMHTRREGRGGARESPEGEGRDISDVH